MMLTQFLDKYIDDLIKKQNESLDEDRKNLFSKKDYYTMLKPVCDVIIASPASSMSKWREELYQKSGIENEIRDFFLQKKIVSGAVMSYGTPKHQETIIVGNSEEVYLENGRIVPNVNEMQADTIFDLASITKIFTSLCIMNLVEKGFINLDDEILKYDKRFVNLKGVTIEDLLSFNVPLITNGRLNEMPYEKAMEAFFNVSINHASSNLNPYTDLGIMVLKYVIEAVTKESYYQYLDDTILKKFAMVDTNYLIPSYKLNRVASNNFATSVMKDGHIFIDSGVDKGIVHDPKARLLEYNAGLMGHAGLFTTASDMTSLMKGIINHEVLSDEILREFVKNRRGKKYYDENGNSKYVQYFGYMTYSKHPILKYSEVFHALSGLSFAGAGFTGTQMTVDPLNELYFFLGSNRVHNRLISIPSEYKEKIQTIDGVSGIYDNDKRFIVDAKDFAYKRDDVIIHPIMRLLMQYKMLEDVVSYYNMAFLEEETKTVHRIK